MLKIVTKQRCKSPATTEANKANKACIVSNKQMIYLQKNLKLAS